MSNYKNNSFPPGTGPARADGTANGSGKPGYESTLRNGRVRNLVAPEGHDMGGWDAYRRWLSRVQSPDKRRASTDPALYTWKGYRNWSDKIRRDWKDDE